MKSPDVIVFFCLTFKNTTDRFSSAKKMQTSPKTFPGSLTSLVMNHVASRLSNPEKVFQKASRKVLWRGLLLTEFGRKMSPPPLPEVKYRHKQGKSVDSY